MKRTLTILFFIALVAEVVGIYLDSDIKWMTRPLVTTMMIIYYAVISEAKAPLLLLGLVAALLGDMFLLLPEGAGFTLWAFVFILTYVIIATLYNKVRQGTIASSSYPMLIGAVVLVGGIGAYIFTNTDQLKILLAIQALAGLLMIALSILRVKKLPGYQMVVLGSVLFVAGHLLTSVFHMVTDIEYGTLLAAILYGIGIYLIVEGSVKGDEVLVQL
jgi:uncharacterized membrane protein YhhN